FFAVSILGIIGGFLFLVESFTVLAQAKSAFILIFGSGLLAIGASSLVLLGISYVARFFGLLIVRLVQFVLKKGKVSLIRNCLKVHLSLLELMGFSIL
ncbi:hypothetical protein, partial [Streptococcus pneumoniae]|uniref:hypothetical protein n=1 Tax=Streptococcus pneumoniae TaxID=1313 RepID=UPI000A614F84